MTDLTTARALPPPAALSAAPEVQALVEAAVKRALEAAADKCADRSLYIEDCIKWGGSKTYITSLKGGIIELSDTGQAIRAIAADPDAVKRIAEGRHE